MSIFKVVTPASKKMRTSTMSAVRMHSYGGPEVLRYEEVSRPRAGVGEIMIKVHAAGVNPVDWKIREGYLRQMANHTLPLIPGWDFSGVVDSAGPGAERFQEGDEVFGRGDLLDNGAYAEYIVMREEDVEYKPKSVDHIHAAAIPLASLTAWQSLFEAANIRAGQSVLIHAAAGGVGHFAVQLAKWAGARVIGTASGRNHDFLMELGVDEAIDYQTTRFEDIVGNVDVVLDAVGGDTQKRSWKVLAKGGILFSHGPNQKVPKTTPYKLMAHLTVTHRCLNQPQLVLREYRRPVSSDPTAPGMMTKSSINFMVIRIP